MELKSPSGTFLKQHKYNHTMSPNSFACYEFDEYGYEYGTVKKDAAIESEDKDEDEEVEKMKQLEMEEVSPSCEASWLEDDEELEQE